MNILVGGGSKGIGRAIALEFAKLGGTITILGRTESDLKATLQELNNLSNLNHQYFTVDLSKLNEVKEFLNKFEKVTFDIIVNNSGGPKPGELLSASLEEFYDAFQSHILASQLIAKQFLPKMQSKGFGRVINIISTSVRQPISNLGVSNTIRGAMASWSKTLSNEYAQYGITVNNLLPGFTKTERLEKFIESEAKRLNKTQEETKKDILQEVPSRRLIDPQETAHLAIFLASNFASGITGSSIAVDGGRISSI